MLAAGWGSDPAGTLFSQHDCRKGWCLEKSRIYLSGSSIKLFKTTALSLHLNPHIPIIMIKPFSEGMRDLTVVAAGWGEQVWVAPPKLAHPSPPPPDSSTLSIAKKK
eukprot:gene26739-biopygen4909